MASILVVEDNIVLSKLYVSKLTGEGHTCTKASNGIEG